MGFRPWLLLLLLALPAFGQAPTRVVSTLGSLGLTYPGTTQPHVQVLGQDNPGDWGPARTFRWDSTNALPTNAWRRATRNGVGRWIYDGYGETGTWSVSTVSERDAIPFNRRTEGMLVYVQSSPPTMYRLDAGRNSWTEIPLVSTEEQSLISTTADRDELRKKLSSDAIPLTVRQSTDDVLAGFVRNSEAFDPVKGSHVSSNVMRSFPISFGSQLAEAILVERQGTNVANPATPVGQLVPTRLTASTNVIAGPFGTLVSAIAYTDDTSTNSHYIRFDDGPANSAPVHFGILFKPQNLTNIIYDLQMVAQSNSAWYAQIRATLTGNSALPAVTQTSAGPVTFHDGAFVRMSNGWWYAWINATVTNAPQARVFFGANIGLATIGNTSTPSFSTAGYNFSSTPAALETPIYPMSKTNGQQILSKPQDTYAYTLTSPVKAADGSILLWMRNGFKQPIDATLLETTSGGLSVRMTRSQLLVSVADQSSGVSVAATVPQLTTFGERLVVLTWTTNGVRVYLDGGLVGASGSPSGALALGNSGVIGRSVADTNHWSGHLSAVYLNSALSEDEVALLPGLIGPSSGLSTFEPLASRTGTEGADAPLPLNEVVWSPRFVGAGNYPYNATNKAREFHATASMWVYFTTNDTRVAGMRAVTPLLGAAFNPALTQNTNALQIDFNTGQNMKPTWYVNANIWNGCANRPVYRQAVVDTLAAYYNLGIRHVQHDDPGINYILALPFLQYLYGTGSALGSTGAVSRGCVCPSCVADAAAIGYGTLTTANLRNYQTQTTTNYWQWVGRATRTNSDMKISANLGTTIAIYADGYKDGRFHYPFFEVTLTNTYPDKLISDWSAFEGRPLLGTLSVNTLASYEDDFGPSDRTRRWMAGCYAIGFLPILPWDVYNGDPVVRTFAGRASIVDLTGFVRAKGDHLLRGYSLAGAIGTSTVLPADRTTIAWASTNQVMVTVRYRAEDGRRVVHCVDSRDTPTSFTLSWWKPILGSRSAVAYRPAAYSSTDQDAAVSTGNFVPLATSSSLDISTTNSVSSVTMPAGLWQIVEVFE